MLLGCKVNFLPFEGDISCDQQLFGHCSQHCHQGTEFQFGYECYCEKGYILLSDNQTCLVFGELCRAHNSEVVRDMQYIALKWYETCLSASLLADGLSG